MDGHVVDVLRASIFMNEENHESEFLEIPSALHACLEEWEPNLVKLQRLQDQLANEHIADLIANNQHVAQPEADVQLLPPITNPSTFRDFYAFEQHVRAARKLRGLDMHPDWFRLPIFYFSNPNALYGHGDDIPYPQNTEELDFELEFAVIIANGGRNVKAKDADRLIAGYTICNDWSSRNLQREEMPLSLGPAKGKDFATSFGPYMVTPDELADAWDDEGKLQLSMTCHVNDKLISEGNTNDLYHSFPTMIERASMNANLVAGDYLGSGTVGTGCILELRPENTGGWIKKGDVVRLEVERLGTLENKIL
jgi:fumarylacetoacetate (FAA) hydrolase